MAKKTGYSIACRFGVSKRKGRGGRIKCLKRPRKRRRR